MSVISRRNNLYRVGLYETLCIIASSDQNINVHMNQQYIQWGKSTYILPFANELKNTRQLIESIRNEK